MAEHVCLRSLWETLSAAASTLALFVAASWGNASSYYEDSIPTFGAITSFAVPLFPSVVSVVNVIRVRRVKSALRSLKYLDHGCIAIITLCPIFIQIPGGTGATEIPAQLRSFLRVEMSREEFEDRICPLELQPTARTSSAGSADVPQNPTDEWVCLKLPSNDQLDAIKVRIRLLSSGLAPKQKQLNFIRARNRFQTVVTLLQAGGCLLSVLQRLVQHLGISPVEAIATFLSILVALQLLMELYTCETYQRPLLLRLDAQQLDLFLCDAHTIDVGDDSDQEDLAGIIFAALMGVLMGIPALYDFSHYVHTHLISALSSFFFFLSQMLFTGVVFAVFYKDISIEDTWVFVVCGVILYGSSMIVAVVGTIVEWSAFHSLALHNWFAWILPHVSS